MIPSNRVFRYGLGEGDEVSLREVLVEAFKKRFATGAPLEGAVVEVEFCNDYFGD